MSDGTAQQLHATLKRREDLQMRVVNAVAHLDRTRAMFTIMSWMSIEDILRMIALLEEKPDE